MRKVLQAASVAVLLLSGCAGGSKSSPTPAFTAIGIEPWTVQPGEDRIWCKTMKVPAGATLDVSKFTITMTPGSHHFILYRSSSNVADGFGACPNMNNEEFIVGSQNPGTFEFGYPQGLAMPLFAGEQLILQSHYVNASTSAITAQVDVQMDLIPHAQVTDYVETFLIPDYTFTIPGNVTGWTDGGKDEPELAGLNILSISSHMHKRGVRFTIDEVDASSVSERLFETTIWDAPPITVFTPPRVSDSTKKLHYQCTWNNETSNPINFGPTTEDEMCIMVVTVFPALDWAP